MCLVVFGVLAWLHTGVRRHLAKLGNIAHILNLCLFFVSTGYRVWSVIELPDDVDPDSNTFVNFRTAADKLKTATDINALYDLHSGASLSLVLSFTVAHAHGLLFGDVALCLCVRVSSNAFLTWVKVFKYLEFIPKLKILLGTLGNAAGKVSGFSFITAVVLFGSSQAFTLAFGTSLEAYRNLTQSFFSLTRVLFGDFDFEALRMESPFMGPLMFFSFSMLGVFILLNMYARLCLHAYPPQCPCYSRGRPWLCPVCTGSSPSSVTPSRKPRRSWMSWRMLVWTPSARPSRASC